MNKKVASFLHATALVVCTLAAALPAIWGGFALWYQLAGGPVVRVLCVALWSILAIALLVDCWRRKKPFVSEPRGSWPGTLASAWRRCRPAGGLLIFAVAFGLLLLWWHTITPSNDRVWADDVARMTHGTVSGDRVVLYNVRDFDWRSDEDYTPHWETRSYDMSRLESVDMILSYWGSPAIAHVLLSFGFVTGEHVVFSVEIRREKTESFSEVGGFFKEFELSVIAADERDVVRVRTNVRGEDDYLYRVRLAPATVRSLFLAYVEQANELVHTPRFYNTITVNCTTLVYHMMRHIVGHLPMDYRLLLSGYLPEYVHDVGALDQRYSLEELRRRGRITERAKMSGRNATFSADIRRGIPELGDSAHP